MCACVCAGAKSHTHMLVVVLLVMVKSIFNMLTDFSVIFLVFVFVFFCVNFFTKPKALSRVTGERKAICAVHAAYIVIAAE